jgi:dolichol-phosphate mannosyltransferase
MADKCGAVEMREDEGMSRALSIVVIPTVNEGANLRRLLPNLLALPVDVLVVDDASTDDTLEVVESFALQTGRVSLFRRPAKLGLGNAYRTGFAHAMALDYQYIIQMDGDGSHRVVDLEKMLGAIASAPDIDLAIGSRWIPGGAVANWPKRRELLSRVANLYSRFMLNLEVRDNTAGFRIYRADFLRCMNLDSIESEGYAFQIEMTREARRVGAKIVEFPILFVEREIGVSKMSSKIIREALFKVTKWGIARLFAR